MPSMPPEHPELIVGGTTHVDRLYDDGGFWRQQMEYTKQVNQWLQAQGNIAAEPADSQEPLLHTVSSDLVYGTHATSLSEDDGAAPASASFVMAQMKLGVQACFTDPSDTAHRTVA